MGGWVGGWGVREVGGWVGGCRVGFPSVELKNIESRVSYLFTILIPVVELEHAKSDFFFK